MAVKIQTGNLGFTIEVDGNVSEPHRYDHAGIVKGPSGKLYCAYIQQGPQGKPDGKPQAYILTPVDSVHIDKPLPADYGGEDGYVEDDIYEDPDSEGEGEEGDEGEDTDADADGDDGDTTDDADDDDEYDDR